MIYTIGKIAEKMGVTAHTLRYWEKAFVGAIRPITGAGGRRYYRDEDVKKIESIRGLLYDNGYTIAGVKKLLMNGELQDITRKTEIVEQKVQSSKSKVQNNMDPTQIDHALELLDQAIADLK